MIASACMSPFNSNAVCYLDWQFVSTLSGAAECPFGLSFLATLSLLFFTTVLTILRSQATEERLVVKAGLGESISPDLLSETVWQYYGQVSF